MVRKPSPNSLSNKNNIESFLLTRVVIISVGIGCNFLISGEFATIHSANALNFGVCSDYHYKLRQETLLFPLGNGFGGAGSMIRVMNVDVQNIMKNSFIYLELKSKGMTRHFMINHYGSGFPVVFFSFVLFLCYSIAGIHVLRNKKRDHLLIHLFFILILLTTNLPFNDFLFGTVIGPAYFIFVLNGILMVSLFF